MSDGSSTLLSQNLFLVTDRRCFFSPSPVHRLSRYLQERLIAIQIRNCIFLIPVQFLGIFIALTTPTPVILFFILSFHQRNENRGFFYHLHKPFFCTKTFVDTANGQQNRLCFPTICIFTQALVDLTNIPRVSL